MKKYIDVDLLKSELQDLNESERLYYMGVFDIINSQPAADVAEIVRCKDCKHWHGGDCFRIELTRPNDFCSFGEKIKEK